MRETVMKRWILKRSASSHAVSAMIMNPAENSDVQLHSLRDVVRAPRAKQKRRSAKLLRGT